MKDFIARVANALDFGVDVRDIRQFLLIEEMSEEDIYLTYIAGKLLHQERCKQSASQR